MESVPHSDSSPLGFGHMYSVNIRNTNLGSLSCQWRERSLCIQEFGVSHCILNKAGLKNDVFTSTDYKVN